jgi:phosphonate transport system substrate-binding protein
MTHLRPLSTAAAVACLAALPLAAQQPTHVTLGVYSFKQPTEVVRDFAAATDELERLLTRDYQKPVAVHLRVFKTYDECLDRFVAGDVDIVRFGPASYVLAKARNPRIQLLVAEQEDGKKRCHGVIAVRRDSPIRTLADLKGRTFAFGDENSTIGRYLSQAELVRNGVLAEDLKSYRYLDRHDKVFKVVEVGDFDAGAMHIATFEDLNGEKAPLREVARFVNAGKPWVARAGLDEALVQSLRRSLLSMTAEAPLKALKVHGFLATTDEDFKVIREGMKTSESFARTTRAAQPAPSTPAAQPAPGKE